jgi:tetratricopeptide (TPR) repeat protein
MSFKEIMGFRKAGDLEKAMEMASKDLETNREDLWNKRAAGWVYYDYLKKFAGDIDYKEFCRYLELLEELKLPADEHMLFDQIAWQVGKFINGLNLQHIVPEDKQGKQNEAGNYSLGVLLKIITDYAINIFSKIKNYHFSKPSEPYSFILKVFMKELGKIEGSNFLDFADWWNFENFRPEDYQKRVAENGKPFISLAEQAYINYSKQLLKLQSSTGEVRIQRINEFIPKLDKVIKDHPELEYPLYFKAKLFLLIGKTTEVRDFILPFVKRKQGEFWVWDLLADTFSDDEPGKMACLCKALSCDGQEKMKINVHQKLANLLRLKGLDIEADVEESVVRAIKGGIKPGGIPISDISQYISSNKDNLKKSKAFCEKYIKEAEEILFSNIPKELAVVEFVNKGSKILNFVISKTRAGYFKYDRFLNDVEIGDKLVVRLNGAGTDSRYNVITLEKTDQEASDEILRSFKGIIKINENMPFGHVEDIFIEPRLVKDHQLLNGIEISGVALISYNKKKEKWGWKAIKVN